MSDTNFGMSFQELNAVDTFKKTIDMLTTSMGIVLRKLECETSAHRKLYEDMRSTDRSAELRRATELKLQIRELDYKLKASDASLAEKASNMLLLDVERKELRQKLAEKESELAQANIVVDKTERAMQGLQSDIEGLKKQLSVTEKRKERAETETANLRANYAKDLAAVQTAAVEEYKAGPDFRQEVLRRGSKQIFKFIKLTSEELSAEVPSLDQRKLQAFRPYFEWVDAQEEGGEGSEETVSGRDKVSDENDKPSADKAAETTIPAPLSDAPEKDSSTPL